MLSLVSAGAVTVDYKLSEQWGFVGHAGAYVSDSETTIAATNTRLTDTGVGPLADLGINYTGELFTAAVDAGITLKPNGNTGGLRQQITTGTSLDYKITERLTAGLDFRYYYTELAIDILASEARHNVRVSPTLTYALTQDWLVSASYRYRWQDRTDLIDGTADSNLVFLTVGYNWPGFSFGGW